MMNRFVFKKIVSFYFSNTDDPFNDTETSGVIRLSTSKVLCLIGIEKHLALICKFSEEFYTTQYTVFRHNVETLKTGIAEV